MARERRRLRVDAVQGDLLIFLPAIFSPRLRVCSAARSRRARYLRPAGEIQPPRASRKIPTMAEKKPSADIADLLQEDRTFPPSKEFRANANINDEGVYARAEKDPEALLGRLCVRARVVRRRGRKSSNGNLRTRNGLSAARSTRASIASIVTCAGARRNKAALIWEGEPGDRRTLTYFDLYRQVGQFANVLKSLGVKRATAWRFTFRSFPSSRSRCWRARALARRTRSSSAVSAPNRFATASTMPSATSSSPPMADGGAARSSRSSRWPTKR